MEDKVLKALQEAVEEMESREDRDRINMVERMRPQQMLYNYLMMRLQSQISLDENKSV